MVPVVVPLEFDLLASLLPRFPLLPFLLVFVFAALPVEPVWLPPVVLFWSVLPD